MAKAYISLILSILIISTLIAVIFWRIKDPGLDQPNVSTVELFSIPSRQLSGLATFREFGNELIFNIEIASPAAKSGFAVYAIEGNCEQLQNILYRLSTLYYRKASTTLSVTYHSLKSHLPFSVVIYDTPDTMKKIVYCGEVSKI